MRAALNKLGIITLPDGRHLVIVVLVVNSREERAACEKLIADIARTACDYFTGAGERSETK
ncbi:MAG: hypothetical protein KQI62_11165 [Deltaproteobacteria bacterium]|nr:hypothetical protein [Deltaproteobacteria bacterium]